MLRAIRLVVDTGLHHKKWTREQVVQFFRDHSAIDEVEIQTETDRYIVWPGQALAYKIGQLKILELRERAQKELGAKFDIRGFHDEVLGAGALPLQELEERIDAWIAREKSRVEVSSRRGCGHLPQTLRLTSETALDMPELPEVETYARYFARHALDQRIARVDVRDERILGEIRKERSSRKLKGREFTSVRRHGKHLFAETSAKDDVAASALRDVGRSRVLPRARRRAAVRARSSSTSTAARIWRSRTCACSASPISSSSPDAFIADRGLGPDPLDPSFTFARFAALLERRRGAIKSLLMSQEIIAGLGNLWVDETLYGVDPSAPRRRPADERRSARDLHRHAAASCATSSRATSAEPSCRRTSCTTTARRASAARAAAARIQRTVVFGRTTYFCAKHQQ